MVFYISPRVFGRLDGYKIFVDAGHGGDNLGTTGYHGIFAPEDNIFEKEINIEVAWELYYLLVQAGAIVKMSRRSCNQFVANVERGLEANKFNADIFVSIHNNATDEPAVVGTEVLYPPNRAGSERLASIMSEYLAIKLQTENRGAKLRDNLAVLNSTDMIAVLCECNFLTNPRWEEKLMSFNYQKYAAEGIFLAIRRFLRGG
jgi:N-acetylmuramoyl-L-alanine amidase